MFRKLRAPKVYFAILLYLCIDVSLFALQPWLEIAEKPAVRAASAILVEVETDTVLFEKSPVQRYPIASLTKLMTLYLALEAIEQGLYSLDEVIDIPEEAYASRQPRGSSLMFLSAGQVVYMADLLFGLMISSGNDAAVALAIILAGNLDDFVALMNKTAQALGMQDTNFADPAGLDPHNYSNCLDLLVLIKHMFGRWQETILAISAQRSYSYPKTRNVSRAARGAAAQSETMLRTITQANRNRLLWEYEGSDGLKTGYTEEAGYALSATARRFDRRLVLVLLSVPGNSHTEGGANRTSDAITLFDFGFNNFDTRQLSLPDVSSYVPGGGNVSLTVDPLPLVTIPRPMYADVTYEIKPVPIQWAPLPAGSIQGLLSYKLDYHEIFTTSLVSTNVVERKGFFYQLTDRIRWLSRKESILILPPSN